MCKLNNIKVSPVIPISKEKTLPQMGFEPSVRFQGHCSANRASNTPHEPI